MPYVKKIAVAHTLATDVGIFIKNNPKATNDDIHREVERIIQTSGDQAAFKGKTGTVLDDESSISQFIREIQDNPDAAGETLLKLVHKVTSLAAHEHLKDYAKESAYLVPFPYNIHLALFVASFHMRLIGTSLLNWVRGKPVSAEELKHNVYKNHLSRVLTQFSQGVKDTGSTLIAIPGLSGLADYILRNTVHGVLKNTADVLEKGDNAKIKKSVTKILADSVSLQAMDADQLANNIVGEIDKLAGTGTTKVAKETAVSARYSRITKAVNFVDEVTRALWGYALYGAPSGEKRRERFLKEEAHRQSVENERRHHDSQTYLESCHRGGYEAPSSLIITPLTGTFRRRSENRSLMRADAELPNGLTDSPPSSHDMEQKGEGDAPKKEL
ncbi:MAG: hypothetical protein LRZ85_08430 [Alphaproteobacteria bacterium]|nr:hypothetical protein [Alphaproteobacteria bacterium]